MSYDDCLCSALHTIDWDTPSELLGCTISNQAALCAGLESGQVAGATD